jgi:hypothetical protein
VEENRVLAEIAGDSSLAQMKQQLLRTRREIVRKLGD